MGYEKYTNDYSATTWVNGGTHAIDETNLNNIEKGISSVNEGLKKASEYLVYLDENDDNTTYTLKEGEDVGTLKFTDSNGTETTLDLFGDGGGDGKICQYVNDKSDDLYKEILKNKTNIAVLNNEIITAKSEAAQNYALKGHNHDSSYYTKSTSDNRYLKKEGSDDLYIAGDILLNGGNHCIAWLEEKDMLGDSLTHASIHFKKVSGEYRLVPGHDETLSLGGNSLKFNKIYAKNGTIQTSDKRVKNYIKNTPKEESINLLKSVPIRQYTYKSDESNIVRNGVFAQDVRDYLIKNNIGYRSYIHLNKKDTDGTIYNLNEPEENVLYSLSYGDFVPDLWNGWQYHNDLIEELKSEICNLKQQIEDLKKGE